MTTTMDDPNRLAATAVANAVSNAVANEVANAVANAGGLLARLEQEANEGVSTCLATAQAEAAALREHAAQDAEVQLQEALARQAGAHRAAREASRERAEQRVLRVLLEARAHAIECVLASTLVQAGNLPAHPGFASKLQDDVALSLACLPAGPVTIRCAPVLEDAVRAAAASVDDARCTIESDAMVPFGIVVQSGDGSISVDATIERRLAAERPRLSIRIAELLKDALA